MPTRRHFLAASALAASAATLPSLAASPQPRQLFDLRTYHFATPQKRDAYADFLSSAGLPALRRAHARSVGLFSLHPADNPKLPSAQADALSLWLLAAFDSLDDYLALEPALLNDPAYQSAGRTLLASPKTDPAFVRYDASFLHGFEAFPRLIPPSNPSPERVLELRSYQSPNAERALNKIAMFNSGELPVFSLAGMPPVFCGRVLAGQDLPHLTYMICHESLQSVPEHWKRFQADPTWTALKSQPQYQNNVSQITSRLLRPLPSSDI